MTNGITMTGDSQLGTNPGTTFEPIEREMQVSLSHLADLILLEPV